MHCALRFSFKASNNEAKYEVLIVGLKLAREMRVESLNIYSDSQLFVCQVTNEYQARGKKMAAYLWKAKDLLSAFSLFKIQQFPRERNTQADALARPASTKDSELLEVIHVEFPCGIVLRSSDVALRHSDVAPSVRHVKSKS